MINFRPLRVGKLFTHATLMLNLTVVPVWLLVERLHMQTCNVRWLISKDLRYAGSAASKKRRISIVCQAQEKHLGNTGETVQQGDVDDARRSILGRRSLLEEIYHTPEEFEGTTR